VDADSIRTTWQGKPQKATGNRSAPWTTPLPDW